MNRKASAILYVQEELSDARLRCDELKRIISKSLDLVNSSEKKDHLHAVAGDLIYSAPIAVMKLEKALDAAALACNRLDSDEIRQVLLPGKVEELDRVLDEIRIRLPRRTGAK